MAKIRSQKLFLNALDTRFSGRRQSSIVGSLTNGTDLFINTYAKVFTEDELGSFDVVVQPNGQNTLDFFPLDGRVNEYNYSFISYNIMQNIVDVDSTSIGDIVSIGSSNSFLGLSSGTITKIPTDFTSSKILVEISTSNNFYEYTEITLVKDPSTNGIIISDFGKIIFDNDTTVAGLGTFDAYVSGSSINLDFFPDSLSIGEVTTNTVNISIANTNFNLEGSVPLRFGTLKSVKTSISSSPSPIATVVGSYDENFESTYIIAQVTDIDTGEIEFSELFVVSNNLDAPFVEYGNSITSGFLGSYSTNVIGSTTQILYTPLPGTNVEVVLFLNDLSSVEFGGFPTDIDLENSNVSTGIAIFGSADKTSFDLKYRGDFIFEKLFRGDLPSIVDVDDDIIRIPNHFFVTGEQVSYKTDIFNSSNTFSAIGISNTTIVGVGITNKLSGELYVYKVDESRIKLATSAENALAQIPKLIDITSVGLGKTHYIESTKQNQKCIITIDNIIQSPINVSAFGTSILLNDLVSNTSESTLNLPSIKDFSAGDFIKIDDEVLKITSSNELTNSVEVIRGFYGTGISSHTTNTLIEKIEGNYNIVGSRIYFGEAPFGEDVLSTNSLGSVNIDGTIKSSFHGRVFMRSGIPGSSEETYKENYLFDDISDQFNSKDKEFILKSNNLDVLGISTDRSILLINNVIQIPEDDFSLSQNLTNTTLEFTGTASSISYDQNNASIPRGGVPISIGSSNGFGYQPLVSAGGTVLVSTAGTISSVSIGNSGSGYREGIQTLVRVGVQTYSTGVPNIEYIGNATISGGSVVGVSITNPGSGYLQSDPPKLIIDSPLSYSDIPLIYANGFSGLGTEAKIDVVVGQGSSVISFNIKNYGYSYSPGDVLTIETGGLTGIPSDLSKPFEDFYINIIDVVRDKFSGWYVGGLKLLDDISLEFDGERKTFFLKDNGNIFSILSKKGSNIDLKSLILIVLNDVIQVPEQSYTFSGGSRITFKEPPKKGNSCSILFYRGTDGIDVVDVDIEDTVKIGDTLKIVGNTIKLIEKERLVQDILSPNSVETNTYSSEGISQNFELLRPVTWCKQREDININGNSVTKNRREYESRINPTCNLLKSVGVGETNIFVDSLETGFNYKNENPTSISFIDQIEIIETADKNTAIATAVVSAAGTISSISVNSPGFGYLENPTISISSPVGIGTSGKATAVSSISSGSVSSIIVDNPGFGYTTSSPPTVLIESPRFKKEYLKDTKYLGDYGIITAIQPASVGFAVTGLAFDLFIPGNSPLKDSRFTNPTINVSRIKENYYLKISNTNIGNTVDSLDENGFLIGVGTVFLDNVYQVASVGIHTVDVFGYDSSPSLAKEVVRVVVSIKDYKSMTGFGSDRYFGNFSWGLVETDSVGLKTSFEVGTSNGVVGLNSTPTVKRLNPLKTSSYTVI